MKTGGFLKRNRRMRSFRKVEGEGMLQVDEADRLFSKQIRFRDKQCVNCGSTIFLGCSHFYGRGIYATRFDPDNCDTLCQRCHEVWEYKKDDSYKEFKIKQLGTLKSFLLAERANEKITIAEAIERFMKSNKTLETNDIQY